MSRVRKVIGKEKKKLDPKMNDWLEKVKELTTMIDKFDICCAEKR